jgi:hypothetical protein
LVIGEASAQPELIDGIQKDGGCRHSLLRCGAKCVFNLLIQECLLGEVKPKAPLGNGLIRFHDDSPVEPTF